eukprot:1825489-Pleurochrysis_carterae.AAC.23
MDGTRRVVLLARAPFCAAGAERARASRWRRSVCGQRLRLLDAGLDHLALHCGGNCAWLHTGECGL